MTGRLHIKALYMEHLQEETTQARLGGISLPALKRKDSSSRRGLVKLGEQDAAYNRLSRLDTQLSGKHQQTK